MRQVFRWGVMASLLLLAVGLLHDRSGFAAEGSTGTIDYDGPVWLVLDAAQSPTGFLVPADPLLSDGELGPTGSPTILVQIGVAHGGGLTVDDARLDGVDLSSLEVPPQDPPLEGSFAATVLGAFRTADGTPHMITPDPDPIAPEVQQAFVTAAPSLSILGPNPTTGEIVEQVYENQPVPPAATFDQIANALFGFEVTNDLDAHCTSCSALGDLFPHDPHHVGPLYALDFGFDNETGEVTKLDFCRWVDNFDVKPDSDRNPVNWKSRGKLPVAVYTSPDVDATEIQVDSIYADLPDGPVYVDRYAYEDVDGDGTLDLILHFRTQDLVAAGADDDTTSLVFYATTNDGECLKATQPIHPVP